jgi:hypothetical protein
MNHGQDIPAYGLWSPVLINSAVFIIFAFSFFKPKTKRDWRSFPERVFSYVDDQARLSSHMSQNSWRMGGGK